MPSQGQNVLYPSLAFERNTGNAFVLDVKCCVNSVIPRWKICPFLISRLYIKTGPIGFIHYEFIRVLYPQQGEYLKAEEMCKNKLNMKLKKYLCMFGVLGFFQSDLAFLFNSSPLKLVALWGCASWPPEGSGRSRQGHGSPEWLFAKAEIQSCPSKLFQFMLQLLRYVFEAEEATA